jgi:hypothetical protein
MFDKVMEDFFIAVVWPNFFIVIVRCFIAQFQSLGAWTQTQNERLMKESFFPQ